MKKILLKFFSFISFFALIFYKKIGKDSRIALNIGYSGIRQNIIIGDRFHMESNAYLKAEKSFDSEIRIGDDCYVGIGTIIKCYGGKINIGNNVSINPYTFINAGGGLVIGNDVRIAAHTSIICSNHNFNEISLPIRLQGNIKKGVVIEDDVWIGTGVRILDGVKIGKGAIVGAGSVVNKDLEPYSISVGVPAKTIKYRNEK